MSHSSGLKSWPCRVRAPGRGLKTGEKLVRKYEETHHATTPTRPEDVIWNVNILAAIQDEVITNTIYLYIKVSCFYLVFSFIFYLMVVHICIFMYGFKKLWFSKKESLGQWWIIAPQGLEIGVKLMWKCKETRCFVFFPWSEFFYKSMY